MICFKKYKENKENAHFDKTIVVFQGMIKICRKIQKKIPPKKKIKIPEGSNDSTLQGSIRIAGRH